MDSQQKVHQLVSEASKQLKALRFEDAAHAIREASTIDPGNPAVKSAFEQLQEQESKNPLSRLIKSYINDKSDKDGAEAVRYIKRNQITGPVAQEAFAVLSLFDDEDDTADEITGYLLAHTKAREALAVQITKQPTMTWRHMWNRGDDSVDGIIKTLLDKSVWSPEEHRVQAVRDIFTLALAELMHAGLEHPDRAMKTIARLLAVESSNLQGIIDSDGFDVILSSLDIRLPQSLRSQATLATAKLLEQSPDNAQKLIAKYVTAKVEEHTTEDLILAFCAAAAVFPLSPGSASALFLAEGFLP
ncbi:hypothetical protein LTS18_008165, partial [Coniosporium uncinatum]